VIDWTGHPHFLNELLESIGPISASISDIAAWMPRGADNPSEARLDEIGAKWIPGSAARSEIQSWWLRHHAGANTPNWDIAVACSIEERQGLILVEAKANWPELGIAGKSLPDNASQKSRDNHEHIGRAIDQARTEWQGIDKRVEISRDSHYQLANRLAFTWKIASVGIPVVLLYLGFTGDEGLRAAVGLPFADDADWHAAFTAYIRGIFPTDLLNKRVVFDQTPAWVMSRSRPVIEISPSRVSE
jgi:hypothetical protein